MPVSHDPEAGRKLRAAVERYALDEAGSPSRRTLEAVLDCFVLVEARREQLESLVVDIVFRFLLAAAISKYDESAGLESQFDRLLEDLLARHTRLTERRRENFGKILKQAVLTTRSDRPKSEVRDRHIEKQRKYNCYLCGESIDDGDDADSTTSGRTLPAAELEKVT